MPVWSSFWFSFVINGRMVVGEDGVKEITSLHFMI